jgi:hypothetical protein
MPTAKICPEHCPDDGDLNLMPIIGGLLTLAILAAVIIFVLGHLLIVLLGAAGIALVTGGSQYVLRRWFTVQLPTRARLDELTERLQDAAPEPERQHFPVAAPEVPTAARGWQPADIQPPTRLRVIRDEEAG